MPNEDQVVAARGNGALGTQVQARMMRHFVGMDRVNAETRKALLEFSYQLTRDNMDEAYKAVKLIKRCAHTIRQRSRQSPSVMLAAHVMELFLGVANVLTYGGKLALAARRCGRIWLTCA